MLSGIKDCYCCLSLLHCSFYFHPLCANIPFLCLLQVAELRRVNKLYSDQDFHALKNIKVPVAEHSILTESSERERRRRSTIQVDSKSGTQSSGGTSGDDLRFGGPETYYSTGEESLDADDEYDDSDEPVYR